MISNYLSVLRGFFDKYLQKIPEKKAKEKYIAKKCRM